MTDRPAQALEPTGHTIDGTPWEEPRGPHVPDAITRVPKLVWPFVVLAAIEAYVAVQSFDRDALPSLAMALLPALGRVPEVTTPLLGAAYFWSHRHRGSIQPAIVVALSLLALAQLLRTTEPSVLHAVVDAVFPMSDDIDALMTRYFLSSLVPSMVVVAGMTVLWVGLRQARVRPNAPGQRRTTIAVFAIAFVPIALTVLSFLASWTAVSEAMGPPRLAAWFGNAALTALSLAGVTATLLGGARAGESPRVAWRLAAASFVIALIARIPAGVTNYNVGPVSPELLLASSWVLVAVGVISSLLWLAAFALGLPSVDVAETETEAGLPASR